MDKKQIIWIEEITRRIKLLETSLKKLQDVLVTTGVLKKEEL